MITIARVVGAHGLKGELTLALESDVIERFRPPLDVQLDNEPQEKALLTAFRLYGRLALANFAGVEERGQAEALIGRRLMVDDDQRWPLPEGRFYVDDLIDMAVVGASGELLGPVRRVWPGVAHDLLELQSGQLVPLVKAWLEVDLGARQIRLRQRLESVVDGED